jgi:hypothetical protein
MTIIPPPFPHAVVVPTITAPFSLSSPTGHCGRRGATSVRRGECTPTREAGRCAPDEEATDDQADQ